MDPSRSLAVAASILLLGSALACGSGSSSPSGIDVDNEGCTTSFSGTYDFAYTTESGNCGALPAEQGTVMGNPSSNLANACVGGSGTVTEAPGDAGGCTVVAHLSGCQVMGSSETLQIDETATWNAGYTMATGTLSVVISGDCSGTYDLTATQQ